MNDQDSLYRDKVNEWLPGAGAWRVGGGGVGRGWEGVKHWLAFWGNKVL